MCNLTDDEKYLVLQALELMFSHPKVSFDGIAATEKTIYLVRSIQAKLNTSEIKKSLESD